MSKPRTEGLSKTRETIQRTAEHFGWDGGSSTNFTQNFTYGRWTVIVVYSEQGSVAEARVFGPECRDLDRPDLAGKVLHALEEHGNPAVSLQPVAYRVLVQKKTVDHGWRSVLNETVVTRSADEAVIQVSDYSSDRLLRNEPVR